MAEEDRMDAPGTHSLAAAAVVDCHYTLDCSRCCYCCCIPDYAEPDSGSRLDSGSGSAVDIVVDFDAGGRPAACICLLHPSCISNSTAAVSLAE